MNSKQRFFLVLKRGLILLILLVVAQIVINTMSQKPDLGARRGQLAGCPESPNCVSSQATPADTIHYVAPFAAPESATETLKQLVKIAESMPRAKLIESQEGYARFEFRSFLFRYVDDLELVSSEADQCVHVRSASRVGYSDLGVNRKRVEAIRTILRREAGG